jgi:hypothetical protein
MKVNTWLTVFLVLIGIGVGVVSLYMASLSGVMNKMGLVGGDFSQSIKKNELARLLFEERESVDCDLFNVGARVPKYLLSHGEQRVVLSGEMGGVRIICGIRHVQKGNVERGVYTIIKGLYYLKTHYSELRILVQTDPDKCVLLKTPEYERWIEGYLLSTQGRIHEIVLDLYKQIQVERAGVEELCSD